MPDTVSEYAAWVRGPSAVKVPVEGSYNSALAKMTTPPPTPASQKGGGVRVTTISHAASCGVAVKVPAVGSYACLHRLVGGGASDASHAETA